jgi:hypothetical protein
MVACLKFFLARAAAKLISDEDESAREVAEEALGMMGAAGLMKRQK